MAAITQYVEDTSRSLSCFTALALQNRRYRDNWFRERLEHSLG